MNRGPYFGRGLAGAILIIAGGIFLGRALGTGGSSSVGTSTRLSQSAILGKIQHRNTSDAFGGGEAVSVMGVLELDLRQATMEADEAVLEVTVLMGGIDLRVPAGWTIVPEFDTVLGTADYRDASGTAGDRRLVIRGDVLMGRLEIRN